MCNLSLGIEEEALKKGREEGGCTWKQAGTTERVSVSLLFF